MVNTRLLLATPATVTMTGPVVAPAGTGAITVVCLPQVVGVAATPLNVTELLPCVVPRLMPLIVTLVPRAPTLGLSPVILGLVTVNVGLLLTTPNTVTVTGPVVAVAGTGTVMDVALQFVGVAAVPLKVTVLDP